MVTRHNDNEIEKCVTQGRGTIESLNGIPWRNYGSSRRKIEAVGMDAFRMILRISRRDRIHNEEIREKIRIDRSSQ